MKTKNFIVTLFVLMLVSFNLLQAQITGSGTTGYIPKFTGTTSIGNSALYQNGSNYVGIGTGTVVNRTFQIHSTSANNHLFITGTAPAVAFSNALSGSELATVGLVTTAGQFLSGSAINDYIIRTTGSSGNLLFGTGSTSTEKMRITSTGNVGIGITLPVSKLHTDAGNATASYHQFTAGTTTGQTTSDGFDIGIDASGNSIIKQKENLAMLFYTNNTERIRILNSGFVGIGTTIPTGILHTIATGAKTANYSANIFSNTATSSTPSITKAGVEISSTGTWNGTGARNIGLYVYSVSGGANGYNHDAIFNGGGNVGISTSTPDANARLDIKTGWANWLRFTDDGGTQSWNFHNPSGNGDLQIYYNENGVITWDMLTILKNGNVGIGRSPETKLDVNGSVRFLNGTTVFNRFEILENGTTPTRRGISLTNDPDGAFNLYINSLQSNSAFNFINGNGGTNLMKIQADGRVGIGTSTPQTKLHIKGATSTDAVLSLEAGQWDSNDDLVKIQLGDDNHHIKSNWGKGTTFHDVNQFFFVSGAANSAVINVDGRILCEKIEVIQDVVPDFVFEENYNLRTLKEVEEYIKLNKHLPEIPSAAEAQGKPVDIEQFQAKLLQKIEELTLYSIDQQKKIEEQENMIKKLNERLLNLENTK